MLSAGLILYRWNENKLQVLLGHMGGPYWSKRDEGAWSIPKGLVGEDEDPLAAALREFEEEIGSRPEGDPMPLGEVRQKGGKKVIAWAVEGNFDHADHKSNLFSMEWPPKSGRVQQFPELDRVEWLTIDEACSKAIEGQADLFREMERRLQRGK